MISSFFIRLENTLFFRPYLRLKLKLCGKKFKIGPGSQVNNPSYIEIGDYFFSGKNCYISTNVHSPVSIGDYVMIGPDCKIIGGNHSTKITGKPMMFNNDHELDEGITIKNDVWIGAGSIILDGAYLSEGSIIAAGSVVTGFVEPYCIYGGVPARCIKKRFA